MEQIFSNTTLTVNQLIEKIDTGELGLPELQRPFIWKDSKVRDLFDSLMRGYPIGYLMFSPFKYRSCFFVEHKIQFSHTLANWHRISAM